MDATAPTSLKTLSNLFDLKDRWAVVTGGAGLLGRQHAQALLELGASVVLWDCNAASLKSAEDELKSQFPLQSTAQATPRTAKVYTSEVDITERGSIDQAVAQLRTLTPALHILINNAGLTVAKGQESFKNYFDRFESYELELWELALKVNLTGTFLVTQALTPLLKASRGASVINIASDVGVISPDHRIYQSNPERGYPGVGFNTPLSYAASKASLIHMTKYWATLWAKEGIRVNALSPAGVANGQDPLFVRELVERIPLGRMAQPFEYKGAIAFLASDASSFMTAANLIVDGGRTSW